MSEKNVDEEKHYGRRKEVQRRAADSLIGFHFNCGETEQEREYSARRSRNKHRKQQQELGFFLLKSALLHCSDKPSARKSTDYHYTLKGKVDYTASLGKNARKSHEDERNGVYQSLLKQKCHCFSPSPAFTSLTSFALLLSARFFFLSSKPLKKSENALR